MLAKPPKFLKSVHPLDGQAFVSWLQIEMDWRFSVGTTQTVKSRWQSTQLIKSSQEKRMQGVFRQGLPHTQVKHESGFCHVEVVRS